MGLSPTLDELLKGSGYCIYLVVSPIVPRWARSLELSDHTIHFNSVDYSTGTKTTGLYVIPTPLYPQSVRLVTMSR